MATGMQSILDRINEIVTTTNATDFLVHSFVGNSLLLIGSFDLCYYHELEIRFHDVSYIGLPVYGLDSPRVSVASEAERKAHAHLELDGDDTLFRVHDDPEFKGGHVYYVAAKRVSISEGMVYHYIRDDLKDGEHTADWVKRTG